MERNVSENQEQKRKRFVRIAEQRVNKLLERLDSLGKCSDRRNYQYNEEDIKKIFGAIERKTKEIKSLYLPQNEKKKRFKLE
ncbi:MAG: hypothetical protein ACFFCW_45540 [Candidatus Hodarchaeota archaeon]